MCGLQIRVDLVLDEILVCHIYQPSDNASKAIPRQDLWNDSRQNSIHIEDPSLTFRRRPLGRSTPIVSVVNSVNSRVGVAESVSGMMVVSD